MSIVGIKPQHAIILVLLLGLYSCQQKTQELPEVVKVEITDNIVLNWNNLKQEFVKDSLYQKSVDHLERDKSLLIHQILSTTEIPARICDLEQNMVLGDMAFVFLSEVERIGYAQAFNWQFCLWDENCRYPDGVLWYLSENRTKAKIQIENHLK